MTRFMLFVGLGVSLMASAAEPGETTLGEAGDTPLEDASAADDAGLTGRDPGLRLPRAVHARLVALVEEINRSPDVSARD